MEAAHQLNVVRWRLTEANARIEDDLRGLNTAIMRELNVFLQLPQHIANNVAVLHRVVVATDGSPAGLRPAVVHDHDRHGALGNQTPQRLVPAAMGPAQAPD